MTHCHCTTSPCLYVCSFITSGGTGFEVFFTSHAETTRICNLVVATVSKKEVVTLSLTELHFKANRWVTKTQMFFSSSWLVYFLHPVSFSFQSLLPPSTIAVQSWYCVQCASKVVGEVRGSGFRQRGNEEGSHHEDAELLRCKLCMLNIYWLKWSMAFRQSG